MKISNQKRISYLAGLQLAPGWRCVGKQRSGGKGAGIWDIDFYPPNVSPSLCHQRHQARKHALYINHIFPYLDSAGKETHQHWLQMPQRNITNLLSCMKPSVSVQGFTPVSGQGQTSYRSMTGVLRAHGVEAKILRTPSPPQDTAPAQPSSPEQLRLHFVVPRKKRGCPARSNLAPLIVMHVLS